MRCTRQRFRDKKNQFLLQVSQNIFFFFLPDTNEKHHKYSIFVRFSFAAGMTSISKEGAQYPRLSGKQVK